MHPGQICQLSYIMQDKHGVKAKNFFFTVDFVEYSALLVHGFSVEKLKSLSCGKTFSDHFLEIQQDFSSADVIVSHHTAFDFSFMRTEYERLNQTFFIKESFCTMKESTPICKILRKSGAGYKYPKLSELCAFWSISDAQILSSTRSLFGAKVGYHDARFDTTAVYLAANVGMEKEKNFNKLRCFL